MSNRNTDGTFMFSPAEGIDDIPSPGQHSNPGQPSVHPDFSLTDASGDSAPMSKQAESYGGESETISPGGAKGAVLAEGPTEPSADLGSNMAGALGQMPKPTGSY